MTKNSFIADDGNLRDIYNEIPKSYDRANAWISAYSRRKPLDQSICLLELKNELISFFQDIKWRTRLISNVMKISEPETILDVACGNVTK